MLEPNPFGVAGGRRSDRHGVIERHPALAFSRSFLDPGDISAHRSVEEHGAQIPKRGIYDNMRTAVDRIGRGKERRVNARFSAMVGHFLFEAEFCNPASGGEKGQIEKNVQDARHRIWQPTPSFPSLAALNDWLETRCRDLWAQTARSSQ